MHISGVHKTYKTIKVGPLEDSAGNIITQGFLMAEEINGYFSSMFTREDISSLPVPYAKFRLRLHFLESSRLRKNYLWLRAWSTRLQ